MRDLKSARDGTGLALTGVKDALESRVENNALWLLKQPHCEEKEQMIVNVKS